MGIFVKVPYHSACRPTLVSDDVSAADTEEGEPHPHRDGKRQGDAERDHDHRLLVEERLVLVKH